MYINDRGEEEKKRGDKHKDLCLAFTLTPKHFETLMKLTQYAY